MKNLENKVFWTIVLILTIFLISILTIFNYQNYNREKTEIRSNLTRMDETKEIMGAFGQAKIPDMKEVEEKNEIEDEEIVYRKIFMDSEIYTVIFDDDDNILEIISHTEEGVVGEEIEEKAKEIITSSKKEEIKIGNLFFETYAYSFKGNNTLTIIDNSTNQIRLRNDLKISILIFVLLEIIIVYVSNKLTKWIINPAIEAMEKQKQFITDASHELKTPIAVILANSEALENDFQKKWINNIKSETERMNRLITSLLDLSKIENTAEKDLYTLNNLSKLIENSSLTFEGLIYEKKIKFETKIKENIYFNCNSDQIKQLVAILLDNAIKHSEENGKIIISLKMEKNEIIFDVTNKGNPIPKEEQEKIFERFYRLDEARNRKENRYGLGLAIAKNIVLNHNGKISASSNNGYTTFKVKLKK